MHVDIHDTGYYKCEASNEELTLETTSILVVKAGRMNPPSILPDFPPPSPHFPALGGRLPEFVQKDLGYCQHYRGIACSNLIGNKTVYVKATTTLNQIEDKLTSLFTVLAKEKEMRSECYKFAVPFLCYVIFPLCDDTLPYPAPRHVCRNDCVTLEATTCRREMSQVRKHPTVYNQDFVPKCEELPLPTPKPQNPFTSAKDGNCISLNIPKVVQVDEDALCYEGRGEAYRGVMSHSLSSHRCRRWNPTAQYEELSGGHNYCRNPGGVEPQPWCYIEDPHMRKEVCDIPRCVAFEWFYILLSTIIAVILVAVIVGFCCIRSRRKSCSSKLSPVSTSAQLIPTHHLTADHQQIEMQKLIQKIPFGIHEVPPQSIRFLQELGDGAYGKVFRGEVHFPRTANWTSVAIKTLKENATLATKQEFYRDLERISVLQHPHVLSLVAVCINEERPCMLFEYVFQCDLQEFLQLHSPHSDVTAQRDAQILEPPDFMIIALQVASGMEFLSSKRYVHGDLAARNCLVSVENTCNSSLLIDSVIVKISDLGVSRNQQDYFRVRNDLLPVRWMSPESLLYSAFTTESDVWSFGILLWEIFSYGIRPYFNFDNQEVINLVCSHQLLPKPESCPPRVYSIMNDCWHDLPTHRPSFNEIHNRLCSLQHHDRTYSMSRSIITQSSSHQSSSGPSNKTLSSNLSCGTGNIHINPFCGSGSNFATTGVVSNNRTYPYDNV